ncbi:GGDEF domain-containing protein [Alteromonas sp. KC3]|uniref:bifunctional diguanylate cyclase/phosphodiesterase n=1 Tax=unclassified Alteromonas TaxID=2614992 RepID=UPI0019230E1F|nr:MULTISPECIES: EAL domain-containing protein [unclassified Alteromonas]BCO18720.1 GGDEF domain-containing protein [Alteromonas sp. KC3]BCO22683.1 GGDEF domain-containing protein [Alteromonas sp. KC14]
MKLSTQLSTSLFVLLAVVFVSSFVINVKLTREYVNEQLATHAQDTATSLGLSITPYLAEENDIVVAQTMVNAIFDRGFYQYITVTDMDGNMLIERRNPTSVETVPAWFTKIIEVTPPVEQTELNNGWNLAGQLTVQSHPGLANETLWQSVKQSALMFSVAFVFAFIALIFIVRAITKPLGIVVAKINDIQNQKFSQINYAPFTKELTFITRAVNKLSLAVEGMFKELSDKAELFKAQAYEDSLTGVSNRSAFTRHMNALLSNSPVRSEGYIIIIRLAQLQLINAKLGGQQGDDYVKSIANKLKQQLSTTSEKNYLFRLSGGDFALIIEDIEKRECVEKVEFLYTLLATDNPLKNGDKTVCMGASKFTDSMTLTEVLENADSALMASTKRSEGWQFASELTHIHSNTAWRERLNDILLKQSADILIQPIIDTNKGSPAYFEAFARFKDKETGTVIPMSQLIPASERLNLIPEVDKLVISLVMNKLNEAKTDIAINIASASIANDEFRVWLLQLLNQNTALCTKLVFEIEDAALTYHKDIAIAFCQSLLNMRCRVTIEHFGDNLASLSGLRAIQPQFVKISGKLTKDIQSEADNQLFISSLLSIARSLNIQVIAELVESEAESTALAELNVGYQQGYHFAKPTLWQV